MTKLANKQYHIMWVDDKWDEMDAWIDAFKKPKYNIILHPYKVAKQAISELEQNIHTYDGIILDAEIYNDTENEAPSTKGMVRCLKKVQELSIKKKLPCFISTGQDHLKSNDVWISTLEGWAKVYIKEDEDRKLMQDVKDAADKLWETQIKHKYADIFNLCSKHHEELIRICSIFENNEMTNTSIFVDIRKVLSWALVEYCGSHGIPHNGKTEEDKSVSLAKAKGYILSITRPDIIPPYVQKCILSCEDTSQNGCHQIIEGSPDPKMNKLVVDNHVRNGIAPYLISATFFELCTILQWCITLPTDENEIDQLRDELKYRYVGKVEKDPTNKYFCGDYMLEKNIAEPLLGYTIGIIDSEKIKSKYKFYSKHFEPIV